MAQKPQIRNEAVPPEEEQPTRRGTQETTREFDQTFLDPDSGVVHRDYLSHAFRWGFAKRRWIDHDKTKVLDVGCGPDKPLFMILFGGIGGGDGGFPATYTAVDLNKVKPSKHARTKIYDQTNFFVEWANIKKERGPFDLITNFEVIEHMRVGMGKELLKLFYKSLAPGGTLLLSTPVYDGVARAKNHIHEWEIPELNDAIRAAKLVPVERYGTFANWNDIKRVATPEHLQVAEELKVWFGNDVMACFLAPLYPDAARNNTWVCKRKEDVK